MSKARYAWVPMFCVLIFVSPSYAQATAPEAAFLSATQYTNAFFGFSLPLPHVARLEPVTMGGTNPSSHFLFGLKDPSEGTPTFMILAEKYQGDASDHLRKAVSINNAKPKTVQIGGREFWTSESVKRVASASIRVHVYATVMGDYLVQFSVLTMDAKLSEQLNASIAGITFFDASSAIEVAGRDAAPFPILPKPSGQIEKISAGVVSGNIYTNSDLGFSYELPSGWNLADEETQRKVTDAGHQAAWGDDPAAAREHEMAAKCMKTLLWATQYAYDDPQRPRANPLIAIFAIDPACDPDASFPQIGDDAATIQRKGSRLIAALRISPLGDQGGNIKFGTLTAQNHFFLKVSGMSKAESVETYFSLVMTTANNLWLVWMFDSNSASGLQQIEHTHTVFQK